MQRTEDLNVVTEQNLNNISLTDWERRLRKLTPLKGQVEGASAPISSRVVVGMASLLLPGKRGLSVC